MNPHATNGRHTAIVTTRKDAAEPRASGSFQPNNRNVIDIDRAFRAFSPAYSRPWLGEAILSMAPGTLIDGSIKSLVDDAYFERSHDVFNIGAANDVDAISSELAAPIRGDNYMRAVDALLERARRFEAEGKTHTGAISLRFVKASPATLAPQQEDVCMIEIIFTRDTPHAMEMLKAYEETLAQFGGRARTGAGELHDAREGARAVRREAGRVAERAARPRPDGRAAEPVHGRGARDAVGPARAASASDDTPSRSRAIVEETRGVILTWGGLIFPTYFSSYGTVDTSDAPSRAAAAPPAPPAATCRRRPTRGAARDRRNPFAALIDLARHALSFLRPRRRKKTHERSDLVPGVGR